MLILWLEENILQTYEPEKRTELQNINSPTWDTVFKNYCVSCSCPIKSLETLGQLEWILSMAIRKTYNEQSKWILVAMFFSSVIVQTNCLPFIIL